MELFDTHAHYNDEKFEKDSEEIIKQTYKQGITKMVPYIFVYLHMSKKNFLLMRKNVFFLIMLGITILLYQMNISI